MLNRQKIKVIILVYIMFFSLIFLVSIISFGMNISAILAGRQSVNFVNKEIHDEIRQRDRMVGKTKKFKLQISVGTLN